MSTENLNYKDDLIDISIDEVEFSDLLLDFAVETLHDSSEICSIKLQVDKAGLYDGRSPIDFLLDIIAEVKNLIPEDYIIKRMKDEDYPMDEDPDFQTITLFLDNKLERKMPMLIEPIYIKSFDCWLELQNLFLKQQAAKTIVLE